MQLSSIDSFCPFYATKLKYLPDIDQLLSKNDRQQQELNKLEESASQELERYQKYYDKIENHKEIVHDMEKHYPVQQELLLQKQQVEQLQLKSIKSLRIS